MATNLEKIGEPTFIWHHGVPKQIKFRKEGSSAPQSNSSKWLYSADDPSTWCTKTL